MLIKTLIFSLRNAGALPVSISFCLDKHCQAPLKTTVFYMFSNFYQPLKLKSCNFAEIFLKLP